VGSVAPHGVHVPGSGRRSVAQAVGIEYSVFRQPRVAIVRQKVQAAGQLEGEPLIDNVVRFAHVTAIVFQNGIVGERCGGDP